MSELEKLEDLYNMGFICEEEFIRRKEELGISHAPSSPTTNNTSSYSPYSIPEPVVDPVRALLFFLFLVLVRS